MTNPYAPIDRDGEPMPPMLEGGDEARKPGDYNENLAKGKFGGVYWLMSALGFLLPLGIIALSFVTSTLMPLLATFSTLLLVATLTGFFAWVGSLITSWSLAHDFARGRNPKPPANHVTLYFKNWVLGLIAGVSSLIAFVCTCVPLGILTVNVNPITGGSSGPIEIVTAFSGFVGLGVGFFLVLVRGLFRRR